MARLWMATIVLLGLVSCATHHESPAGAEPMEPTTASTASSPPSKKPWSGEMHEEAVTFASGGLTLKGTLTIPAGAGADAPAPAVVLVHGSGPENRDEELAGQLAMSFGKKIAVFRELAEAFGANGYAVLRYDKRTCGPFNGCADNGYPRPADDITPRAFLDDALAGVAFLRGRDDVDGSRVYFVGHSQGGTLAFEALADDPKLAGAVVLAGNRSSIEEVLAHQVDRLRTALTGTGATAPQIAAQVKPIEELVEELRDLRAGSYHGPDMIGGGSDDFWKASFAISDGIDANVATEKRPVLVLLGGYDWNVDPKYEKPAWETTLARAPEGVHHRLVVIPEITHALNRVGQPDWQKIQPDDIGSHVDDLVVHEMLAYFD